jgi:hypothetical protein
MDENPEYLFECFIRWTLNMCTPEILDRVERTDGVTEYANRDVESIHVAWMHGFGQGYAEGFKQGDSYE